MKIEMNEKELKQLVKIVFAGNWLINSMREEPIEEFIDIEQFVYSIAKPELKANLIEYNKEYDQFLPTHKLEDEMADLIDDYDDNTFWQELIERISAKEILDEIGEDEVAKMDDIEEQEQLKFKAEKYSNEFEDNGIKNLHVNFEK